MKAKNISWTVIKSFAILAVSSVLGILLLALAYRLPVDPEKAEATFKFYDEMGWSPKASMRYEQYTSYFDTFEPDVLDDGTDKLILSYSLDDSQEGLFKKAAYMQGYGRYWQGYVILLRPLLYFMDCWDFFLYNGMLQVGLVFLLAFLVWKQTRQLRYPVAVLSSYLLLMPAAVASSLQFSPIFYLAYAGSIAAVCMRDFLAEKDRLCLFFLILGILTCYFDFLTYPLLVWAFPLCWYLVVKKDALRGLRPYFDILSTALGWAFGYVGMFFCKWFYLYAICGPEVYRKCDTGHAFSLIGVLSEEYRVVKQTYTRFDSLYTNWRHYMFGGFVLVILAWFFWALFTKIVFQWKVKKECIPFLVIALSGPAWCFVFTSHTAIHHFFTYRVYGASLLAFMLFLNGCVRMETAAARRRPDLKTIGILIVCMCAGWFCTFFAKENADSFNGYYEPQAVSIGTGDVFQCGLTASDRDIREFGICARAIDDPDGMLYVRIYDETTAYEVGYPVKKLKKSSYISRYVEWKLKPGKEYRMDVWVEDNASGVELLVTQDGEMPLCEYQDARVNGKDIGEVQLLGKIVYNVVVPSARARLYLAFLTGCYLWTVSEAAACLFRSGREDAGGMELAA